MADYSFAKAESWEELVTAHEQWMSNYNVQRHWAHTARSDDRRSPSEVLGFVTGTRYHPEDFERAFFSTRFTRRLDVLGYARLMHWRLYAEEGLARYEVALWVSDDALSVEFAGEPLARYAISLATEAGKAPRLQEVNEPELFVTRHRSPQPRLFGLEETLGEGGWIKALRTVGYAPRADKRPQGIQEALFPYWMGLYG